ncbi:MAG: hypothetical protein PQ975_03695 [Methanobacterium sp.]|jgi:DNA repair exonuclease SbcCD ATPase subunit
MNDNISVLHCKLKKYERKSRQKSKDGKQQVSRRYMIPVKRDQIEGTKFQEVDDIVILCKEEFEHELQKSKVMDLSHEKLKQSLKNKELQLIDLKEQINENNSIDDLKKNLNKEFQLKLKNTANEYKTEIKALNDKIRELERELKRLENLRALEKESLKIKLHEIELASDKYDRLKKSHELLWDVVQEKDKIIRDLEKRSVVGNLINKIRK